MKSHLKCTVQVDYFSFEEYCLIRESLVGFVAELTERRDPKSSVNIGSVRSQFEASCVSKPTEEL